jgi:hypothetical protein
MLYKFKSQATGDLIMLEPNGRQILRIIGKDHTDSLTQGILAPSDMPKAIAALQTAIAQEEALQKQHELEALDKGEAPERLESVSLRQRAAPFIDLLKRCHQEDADLVWGV